jgi:hypothetical protein
MRYRKSLIRFSHSVRVEICYESEISYNSKRHDVELVAFDKTFRLSLFTILFVDSLRIEKEYIPKLYAKANEWADLVIKNHESNG